MYFRTALPLYHYKAQAVQLDHSSPQINLSFLLEIFIIITSPTGNNAALDSRTKYESVEIRGLRIELGSIKGCVVPSCQRRRDDATVDGPSIVTRNIYTEKDLPKLHLLLIE